MKNTIQKLLVSCIVMATLFSLGAFKVESNVAERYNHSFTCTTASPSSLTFGKTEPPTQYINVTSTGAWEAYAGASWVKINGQSTYIGSGNAALAITMNPPIPPGNRGVTLSTVTIIDYNPGCPHIVVTIEFYVPCPGCG